MQSPCLPSRVVDALFSRFAAMYGADGLRRMWAGMDMDEIKLAWGDSLGRFSVEQIHRGLRKLEADGSPFPPTLPQFVAACEFVPPPVPAMHRPALPPPARSAEQLAAGRRRVEQLMRDTGIGKPARRDPLAWAERVVERYQRGDGVAHACYVMAQEALVNAGRIEREEAAQ